MTPNPFVMKFVSPKIIIDGFIEVKRENRTPEVPMAEAVFNEFEFVTQFFVSDNIYPSRGIILYNGTK